MTKKELEEKLKLEKEKCFCLYTILYEELEKQDYADVASRIEYLTGMSFEKESERHKERIIKGLKEENLTPEEKFIRWKKVQGIDGGDDELWRKIYAVMDEDDKRGKE